MGTKHVLGVFLQIETWRQEFESHLFGKLLQEAAVGKDRRETNSRYTSSQLPLWSAGVQSCLETENQSRICLRVNPPGDRTRDVYSSVSNCHYLGPTPREKIITHSGLSFKPRESPYRDSPKWLHWDSLGMDLNVMPTCYRWKQYHLL